jgi:alpha-galactosidase
VNEELVKELADAAAACGVEEFIIDDGWQVGFGDWGIDYEKFPNGLKPVFDYIKSKGMKPGLWMSMGAASMDSKVFQEHPEWFAKYRDGEFVNLHSGGESDRYSACFTTGWKDYIKGKLLNLVKDHGLEYVKLDFAIVASAYRFDTDISGCFAENHPHKDRQESYLEIYRRAWQLYDELHEEAPGLFIDCTFETMGELQLIDYDMCKHAEGNWLSNFEDEAPFGSARIRQMSWWRSPVIPATALVIGNQSLDDEFALYSYKSLCGSLPIMLGDPRKVTPENQRRLKAMSAWLRSMEEKHSVMLFRQDLPGFGEPQHGSWDGFQRINTETKSGGIVGVFKQFARSKERWVTIKYLDSEKKYEVILAPSREIIKTASGKDLQEKGFKVVFEDDFQGELYEVAEVD